MCASPWVLVLCTKLAEKKPSAVSRTRRILSACSRLLSRRREIRIGDQEPELAAAILRVRNFSRTFDQQLACALRRDLDPDRIDAARDQIRLGRLGTTEPEGHVVIPRARRTRESRDDNPHRRVGAE